MLARDRSELEWLSWALAKEVELSEWTGDGHDALSRAREAVAIAEESGSVMFVIVALGARGHAELLAGRYDEVVEYIHTARDMVRSHHTTLFEEPILLAHLAEARFGQGDADAAKHLADEAVAVARRQGARLTEIATLLTRSRVLRSTGRWSESTADVASGLALAAELGAATYEPMLREELGRLHHDEKELRQALRLYHQIGATGHARRLEAELAVSRRAAK